MNSSKHSKDNFEMQFRNAFEGKTQMPPAHLWKNIEAQIRPTPWYKRGGFFWIGGVTAVLLTLVMFYYAAIYEPQGQAKDTNIVANNHIGSSTQDVPKADENTINFNGKQAENLQNTQTTADATNESSNADNTQSSVTDETAAAQTNKSNTTSLSTESPTAAEDKPSLVVMSRETEKESPQDKQTDTKSAATQNLDVQEQTDVIEAQSQLSIQKLFDMSLGLDITDYEKPQPMFETLEGELAQNNEEQAEEQVANKSASKSFKAAFFVGASASMGSFSPNFAINTSGSQMLSPVQVDGAARSQIFDDLTDGNMSGQIMGTGIDFGYRFSPKFSVQSGLQIAQANFGFTNTEIFQNIQSPDIPVSDDDLVFIGNNEVSVNYQFVSLPIAMAYEFGSEQRGGLGGSLQLGTSVNFIRQVSTTSQRSDLAYELGEHRSRFMNGFLALGVHYNLTDNLHINLNGSYHTALGSMIASEGVDALPEQVGASLGIRYYFKRK